MKNDTAATKTPYVQPSGCDDVRARLTLYLLKDLDGKTMGAIAAHLKECAGCRAFAQELEPTLDLLRDALAAGQSEDTPRLSPERQQKVAEAWRTAAARRKKRKPLLLRFHVMEAAAALLVGLFLWGLLLPAYHPVRRSRPAISEIDSVSVVLFAPEPAKMEFLDTYEQKITELPLQDASAVPSVREEASAQVQPGPLRRVAPPDDLVAERVRRVESRLTEGPPADAPGKAETVPPERSQLMEPPARQLAAAPRSQAVPPPPSAPLPESTPPPATEAPQVDFQPAPAAFDSVAIVSSPVVMRGVYGSRSPGTRGAAIAGEGEAVIDAEAEVRESVARWRRDASDLDAPTVAFRFFAAESDVGLELDDTVTDKKPASPESTDELFAGRISVGAAVLPMEPEALVKSPRLLADELREDVADDPADPLAPRFEPAGFNPFVNSAENAFSTFSIDVDTASYTLARNYMLRGFFPPPEAVRTEEFVNFFDYAYDAPVSETFRIYTEAAPSRFGHGLHMLKIGIKGRRLGREEQRQASLTILVDSSGSMNQPDRIGLVRHSLEMLLEALDENDQVAVIQFDSRARLLLSHTPVAQREKILHAIASIQCGGGTNLEAGLRLAFEQAARNFVSRGENRILLMSDGVVNLGETVAESIFTQLEEFRRQGLYLSVFGFGMGTYDDTMLKTLASKGNGAYGFIDSENEARRVFVEDLGATLNTIAEDVKIQVEFNPRQVERYRQLGYELRQLKKEQFRDDAVDAGEVGSGQSVTALYELDLSQAVDVMRAAGRRRAPGAVDEEWLAIVRVRYRRVDNGQIEEIERRVYARDVAPSFDAAGVRFRLAACVAAFAEALRGSPYVEITEFAELAQVLRPVALELNLDERIREFARLVEAADGLSRE